MYRWQHKSAGRTAEALPSNTHVDVRLGLRDAIGRRERRVDVIELDRCGRSGMVVTSIRTVLAACRISAVSSVPAHRYPARPRHALVARRRRTCHACCQRKIDIVESANARDELAVDLHDAASAVIAVGLTLVLPPASSGRADESETTDSIAKCSPARHSMKQDMTLKSCFSSISS